MGNKDKNHGLLDRKLEINEKVKFLYLILSNIIRLKFPNLF